MPELQLWRENCIVIRVRNGQKPLAAAAVREMEAMERMNFVREFQSRR
jgi:hypothetical protein